MPNIKKTKKVKKEIVSFDEPTFCGELAYGYSNKKEAIKAIEEYTGEKIGNPENMEKIRVLKFRDEYTWGDTCRCCGRKNSGVWSWANFG